MRRNLSFLPKNLVIISSSSHLKISFYKTMFAKSWPILFFYVSLLAWCVYGVANVTGLKSHIHNMFWTNITQNHPNSMDAQASINEESPELQFPSFAFDRLTPTGAKIFQTSFAYMSIQKEQAYALLRKPLMCASNVSFVFRKVGMPIKYEQSFSVPGLLQALKKDGGHVVNLPRYNGENRQEIIQSIEDAFDGRIPTGAVIAGCTYRDCESDNFSDAHVGIIGDKNHFDHIMVYHNNWLRPAVTEGRRMPYMVSLTNLYDKYSPREWMPTPWLHIQRNADGKIENIHSPLPEIDDLNPFNENFAITIVVPKNIQEELDNEHYLSHRTSRRSYNIHQRMLKSDKELNRVVCRSRKPLRTLNARRYPSGPRNTEIYNYLAKKSRKQTFLYSTFEFVILQKILKDNITWYSIRVQDLKSYFGGKDLPGGEIWITSHQATCKSKGEWLRNVYL